MDNVKGIRCSSIEKNLNKWQKGLEGNGWNALFIENHDKARSCIHTGGMIKTIGKKVQQHLE